MYNNKSVEVTHFAVRFCYFLLGATAAALPFLLYGNFYGFQILRDIREYIIVPFYAVVPAGYAVLACLDRLLINIKRDIVFDLKNTSLLKKICIACIYAGGVGTAAFIASVCLDYVIETFIVLAAGEFFMALIVNTVKSVIEKAIIIKEENELTI